MGETERSLSRQRAYQLARRARGLCQECGQRQSAKSMCEECLGKLRTAMRQRYQARKAIGVCVYCGEQPANTGIACLACRERVRQRRNGTRVTAEPPRAEQHILDVFWSRFGRDLGDAIVASSPAPSGRV